MVSTSVSHLHCARTCRDVFFSRDSLLQMCCLSCGGSCVGFSVTVAQPCDLCVLVCPQLERGCVDGQSIQSVLLTMRRYRMGLIQTHEQLKFSYQAIVQGARSLLKHKALVSGWKVVIGGYSCVQRHYDRFSGVQGHYDRYSGVQGHCDRYSGVQGHCDRYSGLQGHYDRYSGVQGQYI